MWPWTLRCETGVRSLESALLLFYAENVFWSSHFSLNSSVFTSPQIKWSVELLLCVVTLTGFQLLLLCSQQQQPMTPPWFDVKVGLKLTETLRWLWPLVNSQVLSASKTLGCSRRLFRTLFSSGHIIQWNSNFDFFKMRSIVALSEKLLSSELVKLHFMFLSQHYFQWFVWLLQFVSLSVSDNMLPHFMVMGWQPQQWHHNRQLTFADTVQWAYILCSLPWSLQFGSWIKAVRRVEGPWVKNTNIYSCAGGRKHSGARSRETTRRDCPRLSHQLRRNINKSMLTSWITSINGWKKNQLLDTSSIRQILEGRSGTCVGLAN